MIVVVENTAERRYVEALTKLERIYNDINSWQDYGCDYDDPLHYVAGFTLHLENAMTGLGQAMAALREKLIESMEFRTEGLQKGSS